jgi:hypothetical protein
LSATIFLVARWFSRLARHVGFGFMWFQRPKFALLLCVSSLLVSAASSSAASAQKHAAHKPAAPETTVEVVPPPPPPPPPRPEQMPAVPPQVTFQNGKLTIIARNSTLGDILRAVRTKTGATIDVPGSAPERVVGQFGPGPSRDVMASLLNGSQFNYVMLGSESNPAEMQHLILSAKVGGSSPSPAPPQPVQAQNQPIPVQPEAEAQDPNANGDDFADDAAASDADAADQQAADDQQQGQQIGQPNAKTPEQLLLEMQRQQAIQQQQQQQQQNGGVPTPPQGFPPAPPGTRPNPPQ